MELKGNVYKASVKSTQSDILHVCVVCRQKLYYEDP